MALDTATAPLDLEQDGGERRDATVATAPPAQPGEHPPPRRRVRRLLSPLTRRILALNVLPLAILAVGLLYLGQYKGSLIESELAILHAQGRLIAQAIGQSAVSGGGVEAWDGQEPRLLPEVASQLVHHIAEPAGARVRLFALDGALLADSRRLLGPGGIVEIEPLPGPDSYGVVLDAVFAAYNWVFEALPPVTIYPPYIELPTQRADQYEEVKDALAGETASAVRMRRNGQLVLSVAEPVQHYKRVVGALMLSSKGDGIGAALRSVRLNILALVGVALTATVLLSVYLAGTIARPIRRLAEAAERVRSGHGRGHQIPDLTPRDDEIGDLSGALRDMTGALRERMDAIEAFAADVAHEIKNPLTSLRSAVETAVRVQDPERQRRLMAIIADDVQRLDRLISDISDASRLDAELSRAESEPVDVGRMLAILVEIHHTAGDLRTGEPAAPALLTLDHPPGADLRVFGMEDRLVQVFRNLLANAASFSPPGGRIAIAAAREGDRIVVTVEDEGPGIPPGREEAIFARFYSERPAAEKFGTHSGLGLSISRQIVEAHGGTIAAANRRSPDGTVLGARFTVRLPALRGG